MYRANHLLGFEAHILFLIIPKADANTVTVLYLHLLFGQYGLAEAGAPDGANIIPEYRAVELIPGAFVTGKVYV